MSLWSRRNAGFIVNEDDSGDKIIFNGDGAGVASAAEHFLRYQDGDAENAPKFFQQALKEAAIILGVFVLLLTLVGQWQLVQHHKEMIMQMLTQKFLFVVEA